MDRIAGQIGILMTKESTHFLKDILRQPRELRWTLEHLHGSAAGDVARAAGAICGATNVFLTGIGSSWHAALNVTPMFNEAGRPVYVVEATDVVSFVESQTHT